MKSKYSDIAGQRFGRLVAIRQDGVMKNGAHKWLCKCDCGNDVSVNVYCLVYGKTTSCGCYSREVTAKRNMKNVEDITGKRYGRLTVLEYVGVIDRRGTWKCKCDCGTIKMFKKHDLDTGRVQSCGCYKSETVKERFTKHGHRKDRLYIIWYSIISRCYNENDHNYKYYGGRGIKVCDEWKDNYVAFKSWAVTNGYDELAERGKCTIDRMDVNGDYIPNNCRWVNMVVQGNNRRNNNIIEYNNEVHTISEWSRILKINESTLYARIYYNGWSIEDAFTTPANFK